MTDVAPRPMLIIAGQYRVDAAERDEYVAAFADLQQRARQVPGCLDIAITADALDAERVNNFERWESREAMEAWRAVAEPPGLDVEMRNVEMRLYTVTDERDPFGG